MPFASRNDLDGELPIAIPGHFQIHIPDALESELAIIGAVSVILFILNTLVSRPTQKLGQLHIHQGGQVLTHGLLDVCADISKRLSGCW